MQVTQSAEARLAPGVDERVRQSSTVRRLLKRPEMGAVAAAIAVFIFFAVVAGQRGFLSLRGTANYLEVAAQLGILAIAVALLMIGGEFDLSPDVLKAIAAGDMLFAIDQQQYLQGYLPIVLLTLYATNLNTIANPVLMTGPGFVTQENAAQVIDLAAKGTR